MNVPYGIIKKVEFSVSKDELIDRPHAARLQYRLLCLDPVIKAYVDFTKARITIIYNDGNGNDKPKTDLNELVAFLNDNGIKSGLDKAEVSDYDYKKTFYENAFEPKEIRTIPPYTYTREQWDKMKESWYKKQSAIKKKKEEQFAQYQKEYEEKHPEIFKR